MEENKDLELLTAQQVADLFKVKKQTIYQLKSEGKIPYTKVGNSLRFRPQQIADWIEKNSHA